jgi:hypothetical protein
LKCGAAKIAGSIKIGEKKIFLHTAVRKIEAPSSRELSKTGEI